jgi:hypothetical protein
MFGSIERAGMIFNSEKMIPALDFFKVCPVQGVNGEKKIASFFHPAGTKSDGVAMRR